jgi:4-carboxymuconolactone decarboxylase
MLTKATAALVRLSAAIAARDRAALDAAVDAAASSADPAEAEEVLLQSHLFVGYPLALEALAVWRERTGRAPATDTEAGTGANFAERGAAVCARVYGGQYERLRANVARLHPLYERWMVEDGYGRVLGRPGLGLAMRELCIVGQLTVLGAPRQLYSHLRGARNAGCTEDEIEAALEIAGALTTAERAAEARDAWAGLRTRGGGGNG